MWDSIPRLDGDGSWYLMSYFCNEEGEIVDTDGDVYEPEELPSSKEIDEAWYEYYSYIKKTGEDPLQSLNVNTHHRTNMVWFFHFKRSVAGPCVTRGRQGTHHKPIHPMEFPDYVRDFLCMREDKLSLRMMLAGYSGPPIENMKECYEIMEQEGYQYNRWERVEVPYDKPRSKQVVTRERKALATRLRRELK